MNGRFSGPRHSGVPPDTEKGVSMVKSLFGRVLPLFVLAAVLSLAVAACGGGGGGSQGGGEDVTVASDIAYPPFESEKDGEPVGFDIDLLDEIGKRAGFTPEYQNVTFDGIINGLRNNQYDMAISAMTITPERAERIDFSDPYFNADQSLLVPSDSDIGSVDEIGDATVGVQIGTTGEIKANEFKDRGDITGEVRTFDTIEDAFAALNNGQIDAIINDLPVSQDEVNGSDGALEIVQVIPTGEQYGIAFPKDSDLRQDVNEALQEIKDDGTYEEIYKKWIGRAPKEIPE
ncbi:transporter substrate-binding domain-containing protein [Rubrobacter tropicus]|uniref:Transporter substrate-binding domain-containing protein n=2 Tax=Rubrobacter tropicus TaxID=2653851 RepID=A0A6G8Q4N5_9ACTN|nr:transporter substrate-binding domain-containing protein [Rubrobacter tropicus]